MSLNKLTTFGVVRLKKARLAMREDFCPCTVAPLFEQLCGFSHNSASCFLGLCSWLLSDGNMRLRTTYPGFTQAVNTYFDKLIPKLVPLQVALLLTKVCHSSISFSLTAWKWIICVVSVQERRSHHCCAGGERVRSLCKGWQLHAFHQRGDLIRILT